MFPYDAKAGTLGKPVQVVNAMPPNSQLKPWAADIHLTPNGKFLYASERTTSTLSVFRVDAATGLITQIDTVPTEQQPRAFEIDPTGKFLYVVGEKSDNMTSYAIDSASGKLTKLKQYPIGKNPELDRDRHPAVSVQWRATTSRTLKFQHKHNNVRTITYGQYARCER